MHEIECEPNNKTELTLQHKWGVCRYQGSYLNAYWIWSFSVPVYLFVSIFLIVMLSNFDYFRIFSPNVQLYMHFIVYCTVICLLFIFQKLNPHAGTQPKEKERERHTHRQRDAICHFGKCSADGSFLFKVSLPHLTS